MKKNPNMTKKKMSPIRICVSAFVSLFLTPVLLFIALIIQIIRFFVFIYLKVTFNNKVKLIDSMDAFQVYDKPNNLLETYTLITLQGKADIEKIREIITERLISDKQNLYEKLKCKVVKKFGFYCWENLEKDFDVKNHVKFVENKSNNNYNLEDGEKVYWTESEVLQKISNMYSLAMPTDAPRWEIVVIPNLIYENSQKICREQEEIDGKEYYCFIFRVHHSIMDGISSYLLLSFGLADFPVQTAINPLKSLIQIPFYVKIFSYLKLLVLWPSMMYENIAVQPEENCFHGPELTGPKIVTLSKHFEVDALKKIRSASKSNTVSVLNAAVGGAFNKMGLKQGLSVPDSFTAVTSIPMLPYPNLKPQNRFSGAFFPLLIGNTSTTERIRITNETLKNIIESPLILMNSLLLRFIGILPSCFSQNMTDSRELSVLTSNVPGPCEPTYFFVGDKVMDVSAFLPIKNKTGFGICFVSYCGRMRAAIVADSSIASTEEAEALTQAFEEEILHMEMEISPDDDWV